MGFLDKLKGTPVEPDEHQLAGEKEDAALLIASKSSEKHLAQIADKDSPEHNTRRRADVA